MTRYVAILEKEPGTLWGVWFPDCPGCITAAETMSEAVAQAPDALQVWAESLLEAGEPLPEARDLDAVSRDANVAADLRRGSAAILVPLILEQHRLARANISLDAGLLEAIDSAARARKLTRSAFLASAAREKILSEA